MAEGIAPYSLFSLVVNGFLGGLTFRVDYLRVVSPQLTYGLSIAVASAAFQPGATNLPRRYCP
ncbi:hypothetical protein SBA3_620012 [Candidatus Sulfopaludibacter sp. SbA3]|nr:hypothetical protein SBA3_620012 [Candidatus Sulfopaludibacter sp. SbA3]